MSEIDKEVLGETEQTQQAIVESVRGTITRIDEDKIYDLTEEEVKIIADIIENGTWNTEGTAECANDCKLVIDDRTYFYHSECGKLLSYFEKWNTKVSSRDLFREAVQKFHDDNQLTAQELKEEKDWREMTD